MDSLCVDGISLTRHARTSPDEMPPSNICFRFKVYYKRKVCDIKPEIGGITRMMRGASGRYCFVYAGLTCCGLNVVTENTVRVTRAAGRGGVIMRKIKCYR